MRRAGPWCLLLAAACALGRASPPPRAAVRCPSAGTCFSVHLADVSYAEARGDCDRRGGSLAWVSGEPELRLLLGLLAEAAVPAPALFWVGLKRNASACTREEQPLRGFSWEGAGGGTAPQDVPAELGRWLQEPVQSCSTARCAGLQLEAELGGGRRWGWKERACRLKSPGYLCKYQYEGACPDLSTAGALDLGYRLPFEERSGGPGFSPPGTLLTVACPGGKVWLTCQPKPGGFAWKAAGKPLCPCPLGRGSPDSGRCAEAAGCLDAAGGFACACTPGGPDGTACPGTAEPSGARADGRRPSIPTPGSSTGPPATTGAAASGEKTAGPPPSSSSSSSSNYVFILVTVAVVVLIILVMTVLGVFKICFNKKSEGRGDKEPPEAGSKAEAGSAEPGGAAGGE